MEFNVTAPDYNKVFALDSKRGALERGLGSSTTCWRALAAIKF
jgi:hypothetical protein